MVSHMGLACTRPCVQTPARKLTLQRINRQALGSIPRSSSSRLKTSRQRDFPLALCWILTVKSRFLVGGFEVPARAFDCCIGCAGNVALVKSHLGARTSITVDRCPWQVTALASFSYLGTDWVFGGQQEAMVRIRCHLYEML